MNIPSSSQVLTCDFTNGKRATLQRSPKATVEPYAPLIWWGATQFLYSGYKKQNTPTGITHVVNAAKVASTSKDSKCPCTRESLALGSHHSEGNQGPRCQQQLLQLSSFHNGRQSLGNWVLQRPCKQSNSGAMLLPLLSWWGSSTCKAHLYAYFDLTHRTKLSGS